MSEIVVLGAGLGGTLAAYELLPQIPPGDRLTLIGQERQYHFVPSNPWVAVGWRLRKMRKGESEPFYERFLMRQLNIQKLKTTD